MAEPAQRCHLGASALAADRPARVGAGLARRTVNAAPSIVTVGARAAVPVRPVVGRTVPIRAVGGSRPIGTVGIIRARPAAVAVAIGPAATTPGADMGTVGIAGDVIATVVAAIGGALRPMGAAMLLCSLDLHDGRRVRLAKRKLACQRSCDGSGH